MKINVLGRLITRTASSTQLNRVNLLIPNPVQVCTVKNLTFLNPNLYRIFSLNSLPPDFYKNPLFPGNTGTTITAEDLFYNMGTRKRAMNGRDEFAKVAHVITCYAVSSN